MKCSERVTKQQVVKATDDENKEGGGGKTKKTKKGDTTGPTDRTYRKGRPEHQISDLPPSHANLIWLHQSPRDFSQTRVLPQKGHCTSDDSPRKKTGMI